jgi:hypothetical protein
MLLHMVANCTYAKRRRAGNEGEHQRLVDANTQTARSGEILITYTTFFLNQGAFSPHSHEQCHGNTAVVGFEPGVAGRASGSLH